MDYKIRDIYTVKETSLRLAGNKYARFETFTAVKGPRLPYCDAV
jgi:hypothetical protein